MPTDRPRVVYLTGKGGTGKSFLAGRLAAAAANAGRRSAVVRLDNTAPTAGRPPTVLPYAEITLDADRALRDTVRRVVRLGFVAQRLMASRSFAAVAGATPGLGDLVRLAGIADIARTHTTARDLLVIDAPASGHAIALLEAPDRVLSVAAFGPLATLARELRDFVRTRVTIAIVTVAEDLTITEAAELYEQFVHSEVAGRRAPTVIVNGLYPKYTDENDEDWLLTHTISDDARLHLGRARRQRSMMAALAEKVGPCIGVAENFGRIPPDDEAAALLHQLEGATS